MQKVLDLYPWIGHRFGEVHEDQGGHFVNAACPLKCHRTASLRFWVSFNEGHPLCFKCWAECPKLEILRAVGASWKDCFQPGTDLKRIKQEIVAEYTYRDEKGLTLYQSVRLEPGRGGKDKDFRQRRRRPGGGWEWSLGDVRRVLYRMHDITTQPDREVMIVAGEKDVDSLRDIGIVATTNVCGERAEWLDSYSEFLSGRAVCVIEDADSAGKRHANEVVGSLMAHNVKSLRRTGLERINSVNGEVESVKDATALLSSLRREGITARGDLQRDFLAAIEAAPKWVIA